MKERERKQNCELSNQCEAQAGVLTEHPIHAFSNGFLSSREMVSLSRRLCSNFSFIKVASGNKKNDGKILSIDAHRVTLGIEGQPFHLELRKCSWASPPRRCFRGRKAWGNLPCFLFESKMTETLLSRWTNKRLVKDPDCNKWRIVSSAVSPSEITFPRFASAGCSMLTANLPLLCLCVRAAEQGSGRKEARESMSVLAANSCRSPCFCCTANYENLSICGGSELMEIYKFIFLLLSSCRSYVHNIQFLFCVELSGYMRSLWDLTKQWRFRATPFHSPARYMFLRF